MPRQRIRTTAADHPSRRPLAAGSHRDLTTYFRSKIPNIHNLTRSSNEWSIRRPPAAECVRESEDHEWTVTVQVISGDPRSPRTGARNDPPAVGHRRGPGCSAGHPAYCCRRTCPSRYRAARRCPPRSEIATARRRSAAPSARRSGSQPRRSHSAIQSVGLRCPRSLLHREHAATSFSIQEGPPFTRGTR